MDSDIIEFLILTFAKSHTRINAVMRPGVITQEQQMSIVSEMCRELDLDHFVMNTLFKVMTLNKSYDNRFLKEGKNCCYSILKDIEGSDVTSLHPDLVEIAFGLFSILNSANINSTLAAAATKFNFSE